VRNQESVKAKTTKTLVIDDPNLRHGFIQIPSLIIRDPLLTCAARVLYALLLSYAWQEKECWPGQDRLSKEMGCSPDTLYRTLVELKERKLITWKRPGQGKPNIYHIRRLTDGYIPKMFVDKGNNG
jgi:hypothetical protein